MTIPGTLLSAVLPTALPAVQQTAKSFAREATRVFGVWAQPASEPVNGRSEPTSETRKTLPPGPVSPEPSTPSERLKARIAQWVQRMADGLGLGDEPLSISIVADGVGIPQVEGPAALAGPLQESLLAQPDLIEAINGVSREQLQSDPLQWMPGHEPQVRWAFSGRSDPA
jgi:hypothetical protein